MINRKDNLSVFFKHTSFSMMALILPVFCFADQTDEQHDDQMQANEQKPVCIEFNSRLQIGPNYTRVSIHPHGMQSFDGNLGGLQALYEYRPSNRFYGGVKFAWREGDTHGAKGKRSLLYFDVHERLGYTFANEQKDWHLTLFSGFGYKYLGQKFHPKEGNSTHFFYDEFYFPLGFLANYDFNCWFSLGANFTWMPQPFATLSIVPNKGAHWTLINTVANYYVEMPFTFTLTKNRRCQLIFNPFYEHWQDGHTIAKSSSGTALGIPGNTYNFYGIDLNFAYSF
jgi:hypothetical protein